MSEITNRIQAIKLERIILESDKYTFPDYIRLIRRTLGYSRRQAVEMLNCSVTKLRNLEMAAVGKVGTDIEFVVDLASIYGIDAANLLKKYRQWLADPRRKIHVHKKSKPLSYNEVLKFMAVDGKKN